MITNSLRHQDDVFFSLSNQWVPVYKASQSLQSLALSMLASHTQNNDRLQDTTGLEFARVTPLLSHTAAIQHQRHLHLGFNKHLS